MREPVTRVLAATAHFGNEAEVRAFAARLAEIPKQEGWSVGHAIADNSHSWSHAPLPDGGVVYLSPANLGYLNGCDYALRRWRAANSAPDWVLVSNTDITLHSDFWLALASASLPEDCGIVAPDIRMTDGSPQNPFLAAPATRRMMRGYLRLFRHGWLYYPYALLGSLGPRRYAPPPADAADPHRIYAAHGSAFLMHRRFFEAGGSLAYGGFMYGEELHLAEEVVRVKLAAYYVPALRVEHKGAETTARISSSQVRRWQYDSARANWAAHFANTTQRTNNQKVRESA